jgi:hypothetical protein
MITPPEGFLLSEDSDPDEVRFFREVGCYLVGLCFLARRKNIVGHAENQVQPFFRSGFVMEFNGRWYWVTAGHILEEIILSQQQPEMVLETFRLVDHYGSKVIDKNPIPFNFEQAWKHYENNDSTGLDYGAVELGKLEQLNLGQNGIKVLPMALYHEAIEKEWDEFFMYGLATDSISIKKTSYEMEIDVRATSHPSLIHIEKFDGDLSKVPPTQFLRFYGKLSENWPTGEIDGMSGGPVFGWNDQTGEYAVIAIQSGWFDQRRITYACPVSEFCPRLIAAISARKTP